MNELATTSTISEEMVDTIRRTVARDANDIELRMFLHQCQVTGLDPLMKEVWFIKLQGSPTILTSRDGYLKIANTNPAFDGLESGVIYSEDSDLFKGQIVGAWAKVYRKDRSHPTEVRVPFKDYVKNSQTWRQYPHAMIQKVAEAMALKRAFSISGMVTREEIDQGDISTPVVAEFSETREDKAREAEKTNVPVEKSAPKKIAKLLEPHGNEAITRRQVNSIWSAYAMLYSEPVAREVVAQLTDHKDSSMWTVEDVVRLREFYAKEKARKGGSEQDAEADLASVPESMTEHDDAPEPWEVKEDATD